MANDPSIDSPVGDTLTPLQFAGVILRRRRLIATTAVVAAVLVGAVLLVLPRTYTAVASFVPFAGDAVGSRAAGLAAQFGVSLPTGPLGQSPDFYAEMVTSREILHRVVLSSYQATDHDSLIMRGTLVDFFDIRDADSVKAVEKAIAEVGDLITASPGRLTGVVSLSVRTRWPDLSIAILERVLSLVNEFNLTRRSSQAAEERRFAEERLGIAQTELRTAENALQRFLQENRNFQSSPTLQFEHDRLQRELNLRQQLYAGLAQSFEQARLAEVRDTPVITVVQSPDAPHVPDRRRLVLKCLLAFSVGAALALLMAFLLELLADERTRRRTEAKQFDELVQATLLDIKRPWRLLSLGRERG